MHAAPICTSVHRVLDVSWVVEYAKLEKDFCCDCQLWTKIGGIGRAKMTSMYKGEPLLS